MSGNFSELLSNYRVSVSRDCVARNQDYGVIIDVMDEGF